MAIQFLRADAIRWGQVDPVLEYGQPGFDRTNFILKIGNGSDRWSELPSIGGVVSSEEIADAVEAYLESHPSSVTHQDIEDAISAHRNQAEPHKAYDIDIPSLTVLFENGLA